MIPGWVYRLMAKERNRTGGHKPRNIMTEPRDKESDPPSSPPNPELCSPGWGEDDDEQARLMVEELNEQHEGEGQ